MTTGNNQIYPSSSRKLSLRFITVAVTLIILGIGLMFSWFEAHSEIRNLNETMLAQARMLTESLDRDRITRLSGTLADTASSDYKFLREKIIRIREANPKYRFMYLMGKHGSSKPFFYMGTALENSTDYSPPGQIYEEDSPTLNAVFAKNQASISPPFKDRWGTWISTLIPITDPNTGKVIAVFGMDVDAADWRLQIIKGSILPFIMAIIAIVLIGAGTENIRRRQLATQIALKQKADDLQRENEEFRLRIFEHSQIPIVVIDVATFKIIECNQAAVEIFGLNSRDELMASSPVTVSQPFQYDGTPSSDKAKRYIEKAIRDGLVVFDWLHRRPNGEIWDGEIHLMSFRTGDRQMVQFTISDITERKRVEQKLREEQEFTSSILEGIPGLLYIYDDAGQIVRWNKNLEILSGFHSDEVNSMKVTDWFGGKQPDTSIVENAIKEVLESGIYTFEANLVTKDDRSLPFYFTCVKLIAGNKRYFTGIGIDLSERKQAELEKDKLQKQLLQSQKMEAVGHLAGGVAHDFNNMLAAIIGYSEMALLSTPPKSKLHEEILEIHKAANKSADLTRQLLAFARQQPVKPVIINLNQTVDGMLKMLRRLIGEDLELDWKPSGTIWNIEIDPTQIDQILANLVVNARDAIKSIRPIGTITISTENYHCSIDDPSRPFDLPAGQYVRLNVSDNGCGMTKEVLQQVFEPFFSTKGVGKGTGLGLSTVYGIVKQNKGTIHVYSEPEVGSTFSIFFVRHESDEIKTQSIVANTHFRSGSETILLVEDEHTILNLVEQSLKNLGYNVIAAGNPVQAIALIKQNSHSFDLVITDVIMPEMTGREMVLELVKLRDAFKVLYMSGYPAEVIATKGVLDVSVNFIQKPFSLIDFSMKVRSILDAKLA